MKLLVVVAVGIVIGGVILTVKKPGGGEPAADEHNILANPGFEEGRKPWIWLDWSKGWSPFTISSNRARTGSSSALLSVRSEGDGRSTIVWGVVQEVPIGEHPIDCLEGYYYVDGWERGARNQYIQMVVIDLSHKTEKGNAQVRYLLSGMDKPPYNLGNARYEFVDPEKKVVPIKGEWVRFTVNPAGDFQKHWSYTPPAGNNLRVLFEARFDSRKPEDKTAKADIYYDDLYLGNATSKRCGEKKKP